MHKELVIDAEFDSLDPTIVWCIVTADVETEEITIYRRDEQGSLDKFVNMYTITSPTLVGHSIVPYDIPCLNRLLGVKIPSVYPKAKDTLICSRLTWFARKGGHSIENFGDQVKLKKKEIDVYDDPSRIDDYVERCISDVKINLQIYKCKFKRFFDDPEWQKSLAVEHFIASFCNAMTTNGFAFNKDKGDFLLNEINSELHILTKEIRQSVGKVVEVDKVITARRKKDGEPDSRTLNHIFSGVVPDDFNHGDEFTIHREREFNPGSAKDRIQLLNSSGWSPTEKTKTHMIREREVLQMKRKGLTRSPKFKKLKESLEKLQVTGWTVSEENLKTLPEDAPEGARKLAQWLTLEGRRSDLEEWLQHFNPDTSRIHGQFFHIGGWTHRMSHARPNQGNIFSVFHGVPRNPIEEIKNRYDGDCRSCWQASDGRYLVGVDADAIQLCILAHHMGDEEYIRAVAYGNSEDKTDVHNVNLRGLQLSHLTRDDAKTFIYAWLLGAGLPKIARILRCSKKEAAAAVNSFVNKYPGLLSLKTERIPRDASRGYFTGLDGRKVVCNSEHLMLAGYLQEGESTVMKHAVSIWYPKLIQMGVDFTPVDFVHDEWQTEAGTMEEAEIVGRVQSEAITQAGIDLGLLCPLKGSPTIGLNWKETH